MSRKKNRILILLMPLMLVSAVAVAENAGEEANSEGCPSHIYLKGPASNGVFSSKIDLLAFELDQNAPQGGDCVYTRRLHTGTNCFFTNVDNEIHSNPRSMTNPFPNVTNCNEVYMTAHYPAHAFVCGAYTPQSIKCTLENQQHIIINCPPEITIGPVVKISYSEYGKGSLVPLPSNWRSENDQMTLRNISSGTSLPSDATLSCLYSNFSSVRLIRQ